MKDFIHENFTPLLLTFIILCLVVVLLAATHWHDDSTVVWCRSTIAGIIVGITAFLKPKEKKE